MYMTPGTEIIRGGGLDSLSHTGKDQQPGDQPGKKQHPGPSFHSTGFKAVKIIKNNIRSIGFGTVITSALCCRFVRLNLLLLAKSKK
jgi:hypothetical protein